MIFMGKMSGVEIIYTLMLQIFWTLFFAFCGKIKWKYAIKRLTILGG